MSVDWQLAAELGVPILTLFLGAWVARWFENRPVLVSHYGHISAFRDKLPDGSPFDVYSHTVLLRNAGRKCATNLRISHHVLPSFEITPSIDYSIVDLPQGGREIVIASLVPGQQITIGYLYFPPLTYANINAGIRSDEGFARQIPVILQRQYPAWFNLVAGILILVGGACVLYLLVQAFGMP